MSAIESFDPAPYVRLPNLDLVSFVALGHQLLTAQPQRPPAGVKASGEQLAQTLTEVEASLSEQFKLPSALDSRTIDQEADVSWGSLNRRLDAYAQLPHDRYPKAVRAQALQKTLFPSGLAFLNLEYGAQWTEAEQRIKLIAKEKLKATPSCCAATRRTGSWSARPRSRPRRASCRTCGFSGTSSSRP